MELKAKYTTDEIITYVKSDVGKKVAGNFYSAVEELMMLHQDDERAFVACMLKLVEMGAFANAELTMFGLGRDIVFDTKDGEIDV